MAYWRPRGPLPELRGTDAVHAVAHSDDGIELIHLTGLKHIGQVLADGWHSYIEECSHRLLCAPDSLFSIHHLNPLFHILQLEDEELDRAVSYLTSLCHTPSD